MSTIGDKYLLGALCVALVTILWLSGKEETREAFSNGRRLLVRIELGPRDLDAGQVTIVRRDQGVKAPAGIGEAVDRIAQVVEDIQRSLFDDAKAFADAHTFAELDQMFRRAGFARSELHALPPSPQHAIISHR
jgi:prolyl-tRNA synthetase